MCCLQCVFTMYSEHFVVGSRAMRSSEPIQINARWHIWPKRMALLSCGWLWVVPIELMQHLRWTTPCFSKVSAPFAKAATAATLLLRILLLTSHGRLIRLTILKGLSQVGWWRWREWRRTLWWVCANVPRRWRRGRPQIRLQRRGRCS